MSRACVTLNKYYEHFDDNGNKIGASYERTDLWGNRHPEHGDSNWNKIGESFERSDWLGKLGWDHQVKKRLPASSAHAARESVGASNGLRWSDSPPRERTPALGKTALALAVGAAAMAAIGGMWHEGPSGLQRLLRRRDAVPIGVDFMARGQACASSVTVANRLPARVALGAHPQAHLALWSGSYVENESSKRVLPRIRSDAALCSIWQFESDLVIDSGAGGCVSSGAGRFQCQGCARLGDRPLGSFRYDGFATSSSIHVDLPNRDGSVYKDAIRIKVWRRPSG